MNNKTIMWAIVIVLIILIAVYALMKKDKVETPTVGNVAETVELQVDENGVDIAPGSEQSEEAGDENSEEGDTSSDEEEPASSGRVDENGIEIAP